ncbi:MAG: SDR family oxidoreductase [Pseudomonadota bacterium]|nr:SDR family oxidoreductase [Pseudomonadota bacterium]
MSEAPKHVTLITGGSRGIGAATALLCAQNGHAVCISYRDREDKAEEVVAAIEKSGGRSIAVQADTALEADVLRLFVAVDERLGPVTGLVNNAGIHGPRIRVDALETPDVERVLAVNVTALFQCSREAIRRMSTRHGGQGGAIVNVSSGSAWLGQPGVGVLYAASKGAVNSLTIGLSQEVAGEGIRVNAVAPGLTVTDMPPVENLDRDGPNLPIGRAAQPEEIAEAIYWLLTDKASYVAGANLRVGGGRI